MSMAANKEMIKFVIHDGHGATTIVPLVHDELSVGSDMDNRIRITGRRIAGHHARLLTRNGTNVVDSLSDDTPVLVNGQPVEGVEILRTGDRVGIGECTIEVVDGRSHSDADGSCGLARASEGTTLAVGDSEGTTLGAGAGDVDVVGTAVAADADPFDISYDRTLVWTRKPAPRSPRINPVLMAMMLATGAILLIKWADGSLGDGGSVEPEAPGPIVAVAGRSVSADLPETSALPGVVARSAYPAPGALDQNSAPVVARSPPRKVDVPTIALGKLTPTSGTTSQPKRRHLRPKRTGTIGAEGSRRNGAQGRSHGAPRRTRNDSGSALKRAGTCLAKSDHRCVVKELAGNARSPREIALLAETYLVIGQKAAATKEMRRYVKRFPGSRHARRFQSRLDRDAKVLATN